MTQEQKDLLLKDLCSRLPYGVKVQAFDYDGIETVETLYQIDSDGYTSTIECDTLKHTHKPYLFPLSSMTEEQRKEYDKIIYKRFELHHREYSDIVEIHLFDDLQEFYHKNHLDYRDLIPKGLANDATGLNIY